jgi:hypothetical protein
MTLKRVAIGVALALLGWLALSLAYGYWLGQQGELQSMELGDALMRIVKWPTLLVLGGLLVIGAHGFNAGAEAVESAKAMGLKTEAEQAQQIVADKKSRFAAQVVAVQWVGPVVWRDYPTQWNLYRLMGLAEPNPDDKEAKTDPDYQGIKAIRAIADGGKGSSFGGDYLERHLAEMLLPHRIPYFTVKNGFYSDAKGSNRPKWTDVRVEFSGPDRLMRESDSVGGSPISLPEETAKKFGWAEGMLMTKERYLRSGSAEQMRGIVENQIMSISGAYRPENNPEHKLTEIVARQGGPSMPFRSLATALDWLETHPDKTAWVMAMDAPGYPKTRQANENSVLIVLAHPDYDTLRQPLAWIHRVQNEVVKNKQYDQGHPTLRRAWETALAGALASGEIKPEQVGRIFHDSQLRNDTGKARTRRLMPALQTLFPGAELERDLFDVQSLFGDCGAATGALHLALAVAHVQAAGTSALAVSAAEDDTALAVLVTPPADRQPRDESKPWFRARSAAWAYWPWWAPERKGK